jgi:hypothetical protein
MLKTNIRDIIILSIIFTILALWFDIHGEEHVITFIIEHLASLLLALLLSKVIYSVFLKKNAYSL